MIRANLLATVGLLYFINIKTIATCTRRISTCDLECIYNLIFDCLSFPCLFVVVNDHFIIQAGQ